MAECVAGSPNPREGRTGRQSLAFPSWQASCRGGDGGSGSGRPRGLGDPGWDGVHPSTCLHGDSGGGS